MRGRARDMIDVALYNPTSGVGFWRSLGGGDARHYLLVVCVLLTKLTVLVHWDIHTATPLAVYQGIPITTLELLRSIILHEWTKKSRWLTSTYLGRQRESSWPYTWY